MRLEFELCFIGFWTLGGKVFTQITSLRQKIQARFFCRYAPRYLPRFWSFDFVSRMGTSPFVRIFSIPQLTLWVFNECEKKGYKHLEFPIYNKLKKGRQVIMKMITMSRVLSRKRASPSQSTSLGRNND